MLAPKPSKGRSQGPKAVLPRTGAGRWRCGEPWSKGANRGREVALQRAWEQGCKQGQEGVPQSEGAARRRPSSRLGGDSSGSGNGSGGDGVAAAEAVPQAGAYLTVAGSGVDVKRK